MKAPEPSVPASGEARIRAYAALRPKAGLEPYQYAPHPLGSLEVEVRVTHCGVCHSDVHLIDNDWGISIYPLVPGHEIVGTVSAKGRDVLSLKLGQRVGIGWQCGACMRCEFCRRGDENFCGRDQATCVGHHGGFADRVRADHRFAFPIPDKLPSEQAAPLLCGGITVYSPLRHFKVAKGAKVGVVGLGGLGHLAVQFAAKLGCEVTAFSSVPGKEAEVRGFGAAHFICDKPPQPSSLDFILATAAADLDWQSYLKALRPDGKLCFVGPPPSPIQVPAFSLIVGRKSVCGSPIGGRKRIQEMLAFAARHKVAAMVETLPMARASEAVERVRKSQARYRVVLVN